MSQRNSFAAAAGIACTVGGLLLATASAGTTRAEAGPAKPAVLKGPMVVKAARFGVVPSVRAMAAAQEHRMAPHRTLPPREIPLGRLPARPRKTNLAERPDSAVQAAHPEPKIPAPLMSFEGVSNLDGVYPPDSNGDVGLNHYVEMVNLRMCIYDKATGTNVVAPFLMSTLYAAAGFPAPASTSDDGDPVVLYDHLANRWLISQFIVSVTPCHEVIAISQTEDPTGAWHLYDFVMPNTKMNDYPHLGVWPDGYYMTDNQFAQPSFAWAGAGVFAFDRVKMLAGDPSASYQYFDLEGVDANFGGMLPADLDGQAPPPGAPCYFGMVDDSSINAFDALYTWEFHVDWTTPANSTFGNGGRPNHTNRVADFDSAFTGGRSVVPQPGTAQGLDVIADRLMHRLQYRNFGAYETLVVCHSVDVGVNHAGVRYYHLQRTLPAGTLTVADQATFAPDDSHRWMGSAAMDAQGNLAVGYTRSATNIYPSVCYAGRLATDPTGGLFQGEGTIHAGTGSQTGTAARWGDYSSLTVDPVDGVTFWYVSEYLPVTSGNAWHTRIGSFRLGSLVQGTLTGRVTDALSGAGIPGATVTTTNGYSTATDSNGNYIRPLPTGAYAVVASALDYLPASPAAVTILEDQTSTVSFVLTPIPLRVSPASGLAASGLAGGPFAPSAVAYVLTNASASSLTWTATPAVAWISLSSAGGVLAGGLSTTVTVSINHTADFLPAGSFAGPVVFSNASGSEAHARTVSLTVAPYLPPPFASFDFTGGQPAGWSVTTNGDATALGVWRFDDPGSRGNLTGGEGEFAIVDDDQNGSGTDEEANTSLLAPAVNASLYGSLFLQFKTDYKDDASAADVADVDVSGSGEAGPWSNVWRATGASFRGAVTLDVTEAAAGSTNMVVRFHYDDGGDWGWWWQVDDVRLAGATAAASGALSVIPSGGLDASGYFGGPFAPDRLYRLTNSSAGPLVWQLTAGAGWFTAAPAGGTLAPGAITDVFVNIAAAADTLSPGPYTSALVFSNVTEGLAQSRDVTLQVLDGLSVLPASGYGAVGLEGGPFVPSNKVYTLSNPSTLPVSWTAHWSQAWLAVVPAGGLLPPGGEQSVAVFPLRAQLTAPGTYTDRVSLVNQITGVAYDRGVTVDVVEITGELAVYDSIAPTNDLNLPFGAVSVGATALGQVRLVNEHATRSLVVSNILFGLYEEDFNDLAAQGWREDLDANWTPVAGEYVAQTAAEDFMTAVFTGRTWSANSVRAVIRRTGDVDNSHGVILRATEDFDITGAGSGYLFLVAGGSYAVFWVEGGVASALQGWTVSSAVRSGGTNTLVASASGSDLMFLVNGALVWQGTDSRSLSGRIGVGAYSTAANLTTHAFDNVLVDAPAIPAAAMSRRQVFLNSGPQAGSRVTGPDAHSLPPGPEPGEGPAAPVPALSPTNAGPFTLRNLPALPLTLAPGASAVFDVTYAPAQAGTNVTFVTIDNNDNDEPAISVSLSGHVAAGALTGRVTAAHDGHPLPGAQVRAMNGLTVVQSGVTAAGGSYSLQVPTGTYSVVATLIHYATDTVTDVVVPADGSAAAANLVLTGSTLACAPSAITQTLQYGRSATSVVSLTKSGPVDVGVSLRIMDLDAGSAPLSIPASDGSFPRAAAPPSADRAPGAKSVGSAEVPVPGAPDHVLCYGVDMNNNLLVSFYADAPGTFTTIGSSGANLIPCIDFLENDFTRLFALDYVANQLVTFATADAAKTVIGSSVPATGQTWTSLAADLDGTLYAASTDGTASRLYTLDPLTGAATSLGEISGAPGIIGLAIGPDGQMYGLDIGNDNLLRINKATGAGTVIGSIGFDASYAQGMDFDGEKNVLYLAAYNVTAGRGELRIADTATGNSALVGAFQGNAELCMAVAAPDGQCAWASVAPPTGLVSVAGSTHDVIFDSVPAGNAASTNHAELRFSGSFVNTVTSVPLTLIVIPDDLTVTPEAPQLATGAVGGPFAAGFGYAVSNQGALAVAWTATVDQAWLDVAPLGGSSLAPAAALAVTAVVNSAANALAIGIHTARISFVNSASAVMQERVILLTAQAPHLDYFTELFATDNDLDFTTLTFTPNGSADFYGVCRTTGVAGFPTDPAGGTVLTLDDDDAVNVSFTGGLTVPFYGTNRASLFVGSNGYLTFDASDTAFSESLANQFSRIRIASHFDDLNPLAGGDVSWKQETDRVVVTYQGVPEYGSAAATNSFQIELFTNGVLRMTWLTVSSLDGLAGLSRGGGVPADFAESDLAGYAVCGGAGTPPVLAPIGGQVGLVSNLLSFAVTAAPTEGDAVMLNLIGPPAGAFLSSTNASGTFYWTPPVSGVYTVSVEAADANGATSEVVTLTVQGLRAVHGTPVLTADPPGENAAGDAFDLSQQGGAALTVDQGGFGSFGYVYVNYDATNLYLGGHGMNLPNEENAAILFLSLGTLSNDRTNLWDNSGAPQGLDFLHNLGFAAPVPDIAIVLGDEHGDGTFPSLNLGNGYDMGQGVFALGPPAFGAVPGSRLSQFDGALTNAAAGEDDDGNRSTDRWECSIPWTSLNAIGMHQVGTCHVAGVIVNSSTNGADRYLSGNVLARERSPSIVGNYGFSFVTLTPIPVWLGVADSDGDALPDEWELQHYLSLTGAVAGADTDGDGFSSEDELRLGTQPTNLLSGLFMRSVAGSNGQTRVTWLSVGGRSYQLEVSEATPYAFHGFTNATEDDVGAGVETTETLVDPGSTNRARAYRIRLDP